MSGLNLFHNCFTAEMIPIKDKNVGLILKRYLNSEKDKKVPSLVLKSLIVWITFVKLKYTGLFSIRVREVVTGAGRWKPSYAQRLFLTKFAITLAGNYPLFR